MISPLFEDWGFKSEGSNFRVNIYLQGNATQFCDVLVNLQKNLETNGQPVQLDASLFRLLG